MTEEKAQQFIDKLIEIYARENNLIVKKSSKGSKTNEEKKIEKMG